MKPCVIKIENLNFTYNNGRVLENINLKVYKNDFLALLGPNGGGKTTLLRIISGLLKPDSGKIELFGESSAKKKNIKKIGYVPQETDINKTFPVSVSDVVTMGRLKKKDSDYSAEQALEIMELFEIKKKRIGEISVGQRKKVFIARAIATNPEILLLDEPTAGIDSYGQAVIYEILKSLNKKITILIATHDVMTLSDNIKSAACVNKTIHFHDVKEISPILYKENLSCFIDVMQKIGGQA